jgi:hypothetical protein
LVIGHWDLVIPFHIRVHPWPPFPVVRLKPSWSLPAIEISKEANKAEFSDAGTAVAFANP